MDQLIVTSELIERARLHGACTDGLPKEGTSVGDMEYSNLVWVHDTNLLSLDEQKEISYQLAKEAGVESSGTVAPSVWSGSGYGYGYGSGSGDGDGSGSGYGDGSGSGYGDG